MPIRRSPLIRHATGLLALGAATLSLLTACGDTASSTATGQETDVTSNPGSPDTDPSRADTSLLPADGAVPAVQLQVQPIYPIVQPWLPSDWTVVYADGTVLIPFRGDFAAQPQVWPDEVGHVDPVRVAALLTEAQATGLLGSPTGSTAAPIGVADAPRTTVVLTTSGGSYVHAVDGLGLGDDSSDAYRAALTALSGSIASLVEEATAKPEDDSAPWPVFYEPTALDVIALDVTADLGGPGTPTIVEWTADGVELADWTTDCVTITDRGAIGMLDGSLAGPMYRQHDRLYRIESRVHPTGTSCGG